MKARIEFINGEYFIDVFVGKFGRGDCWKNVWVSRSRDEADNMLMHIINSQTTNVLSEQPGESHA